MFLWCVRDGWRDTCSERGLLISSSESQGLATPAPPCQLVSDASDRLRVPCLTAILCTLSKTDCMVLITWSPSGYTPVRTECPDAPSFSCLQIKMWQLTKAHGVTRNEPIIHVICYITITETSKSNGKIRPEKTNLETEMERKTSVWILQKQTGEIVKENSWKWLRKETWIAAQNKKKRTDYVKVKIVNTQHDSKCRLCGKRDETVNHMISEYGKLAQME